MSTIKYQFKEHLNSLLSLCGFDYGLDISNPHQVQMLKDIAQERFKQFFGMNHHLSCDFDFNYSIYGFKKTIDSDVTKLRGWVTYWHTVRYGLSPKLKTNERDTVFRLFPYIKKFVSDNS